MAVAVVDKLSFVSKVRLGEGLTKTGKTYLLVLVDDGQSTNRRCMRFRYAFTNTPDWNVV